MFCFGLQSIARFINMNASYFNTHRLESEEKKIKMLFTGLGRSVFGETVPSVWVSPSAYGLGRYSRPRAQLLPIRTSQPVYNIYIRVMEIQKIQMVVPIFSGFALFTELMWVCRGVESLCKLLTAKKVPFDTKKRVQIKILSILKLVSFKSLTEKNFLGDRLPPPPPPPLIRHCLNRELWSVRRKISQFAVQGILVGIIIKASGASLRVTDLLFAFVFCKK